MALLPVGIVTLACAPTPVVFTPATCRAEPCAAPVRLIADSANAVPQYPEIMASVGVEGTVVAEFVVLPSGSVDTASVVIRSMTNRAFERSSVGAIAKWRFAALGGGSLTESMPVRARLLYVIGTSPCTSWPGRTFKASWSMLDGEPVLRVEACQTPRIPRDQIRPMTPAGQP